MIVKREFDETCEVVYDTSDNSVMELYSGKEWIDTSGIMYEMLFYTDKTTKEDIMSILQQYCDQVQQLLYLGTILLD